MPGGSFAWQIRIADSAGFVRNVAPALEVRLAASPLAGFTGHVPLSFHRRGGLSLRFDAGRLVESAHLARASENPAVSFPGSVFLALLLGSRSLADLEYAFPGDVAAHAEIARCLLNAALPVVHLARRIMGGCGPWLGTGKADG